MSTIAPSRSSNEVPSDLPVTLGALRATGYAHSTVKDEIRTNLIERLSNGDDPFPGIVGFEQTVRPQIERALLAAGFTIANKSLESMWVPVEVVVATKK